MNQLEAELLLREYGWTKVWLTGKALGYTPEFNEQEYAVFLPPNPLVLNIGENGWSTEAGGGLESGEDLESLQEFLKGREG